MPSRRRSRKRASKGGRRRSKSRPRSPLHSRGRKKRHSFRGDNVLVMGNFKSGSQVKEGEYESIYKECHTFRQKTHLTDIDDEMRFESSVLTQGMHQVLVRERDKYDESNTKTKWLSWDVEGTSPGALNHAFGIVKKDFDPHFSSELLQDCKCIKGIWFQYLSHAKRDPVIAFKNEVKNFKVDLDFFPSFESHGIEKVVFDRIQKPDPWASLTETYVGWIIMELLFPIKGIMDIQKLRDLITKMHENLITHNDIARRNIMQRWNSDYVFIDLESVRKYESGTDSNFLREKEVDKIMMDEIIKKELSKIQQRESKDARPNLFENDTAARSLFEEG